MAKKRVQILLTNQQVEALQKISKESDIKKSELIRRILDEYLERKK